LYGLVQAGLATLSNDKSEAKPKPDPPDLQASDRSDDDFVPMFDAANAVTEYEDTPLPGELPTAPEPLGDHADDFESVASDDSAEVSRAEALVELLAAEERLQDEIGFLEDDGELELLEDDVVMLDEEEGEEEELDGLIEGLDLDEEQQDLEALDKQESEPELEDLLEEGAPDVIPEGSDEISLGLAPEDEADLDDIALEGVQDDLLDLDDIDNVDLEPDDDLVLGSEEPEDDAAADEEEVEDAEVLAAMRFNEGEVALGNGDYESAVQLFEAAFEHGFDLAELHAMLAYSRFMAAGQDPSAADDVLELLGYAEQINPSLDLVHAYRGAVFRAIGEPAKARTALERALQLNPYCELAMETMDSLG
jgi:tetratricopeptide (TPR) repeat protein